MDTHRIAYITPADDAGFCYLESRTGDGDYIVGYRCDNIRGLDLRRDVTTLLADDPSVLADWEVDRLDEDDGRFAGGREARRILEGAGYELPAD